jgi:mono/diheme cytochrome c family protein
MMYADTFFTASGSSPQSSTRIGLTPQDNSAVPAGGLNHLNTTPAPTIEDFLDDEEDEVRNYGKTKWRSTKQHFAPDDRARAKTYHKER